jgi:DNA helicase II / ATP-dependent DNA helicase PcrA
MKTFTLQAGPEPAFLSELNGPQRDAVLHHEGPLLIIAGAGSGKTRVLTFRIAHLLAKGHAYPSQILALTFTNKAAREMKERIKALIGPEADRLWMGTFHSVFGRILRMESERLGYNRDFSIYDTEDSEKAVKGILKELNLDSKEVKPAQIRYRISGAKNQLIGPEEYASKFVTSTLDDIAAQVYPRYLERLKQQHAMDFDDLLIKPIELFREHPDVLALYHDRFSHILIDEYQDTNRAQYEATNLLSAKHRNLCVVGDDAQSIYSFRGADISNILNFKTDYPEATRIALEQNYRSTKVILKAADSIIKRNKNQLDKTLWTENDIGNPITVLENLTERDEAHRVAHHIRQLKLRHGYRNLDFAILYRTNYQSRVFEDALRRADIRYQLVGGVSFYQRKEVKDVIAYLRLLINPADEEALMRVINEPGRGIGDKTIEILRNEARTSIRTFWRVLKDGDAVGQVYKPAQARIADFVSVIETVKTEVGQMPLIELGRSLLEKTGYVRQFIEDGSSEALSRRENVMELLNLMAFYESTAEEPSLSGFLQDVALVSDVDQMEDDAPAVTLMSIHASKGLEFPVVFITGLEEELFPIGGRNGEEADFEEERRLFYVAITRARKELFLSHARTRFTYGEEKTTLRSRFLDEVDKGVVRTETGATISQRDDRFSLPAPSSRPTASGFRVEYSESVPKAVVPRSAKPAEMRIEGEIAELHELITGARVWHETFGSGKIILTEGKGLDTRVTVFFPTHGQKKLVARLAKLRII